MNRPASYYIDQVPCSVCGAQPGEPCNVRRGKRSYHLNRAQRGVKALMRARAAADTAPAPKDPSA